MLIVTAMSFDAAAAQTYTNVTAFSGINYVQNQISLDRITEPQVISGGAAAGDYDGDGWVDLYVTRLDDTDILYRNMGNGRFNDVTESVFDSNHLRRVKSNGASWGDVDNDGDQDLYVTSLNSSRYSLFINNGQGGFTDETVARGAGIDGTDERQGFSSTFGDYDNDGYLDLYVTEWGRVKTKGTEFRSHARLLRNQGPANPGHFTDVTDSAGVNVDDSVAMAPGFGSLDGVMLFTPRFADLDDDGHMDLAIAGDFRTSRLFWNNGDGTFTDGTEQAGVGTDENGMGSAIADYNGDGRLDWFVTSIYETSGETPPGVNWGPTGNRLYRNNGERSFTDVSEIAGVRDGAWGWGAEWLDYDNDGDLDLIMTNGMDNPASDEENHFNNDRMRLWRNDGNGKFTEVGVDEGVTDTRSGKGLLTFDYDNDGDLDVFVVNNRDQPVLYRNDSDDSHHYLRVKTKGTISNADGLGARVTITPSLGNSPHVWEINAGSNYLSQSESTAHFGLGADTTMVDLLTIKWPSGLIQSFVNVAADQLLEVLEPTMLGDTDGDNDVDLDDLMKLALNWQTIAGWNGGDLDGTGYVDELDLFALGDNWLDGVSPGQTAFGLSFGEAVNLAFDGQVQVPEPTSLAVLTVVGTMILTKRRPYIV